MGECELKALELKALVWERMSCYRRGNAFYSKRGGHRGYENAGAILAISIRLAGPYSSRHDELLQVKLDIAAGIKLPIHDDLKA